MELFFVELAIVKFQNSENRISEGLPGVLARQKITLRSMQRLKSKWVLHSTLFVPVFLTMNSTSNTYRTNIIALLDELRLF